MSSEAYAALRDKGRLMAGSIADLGQRACVYHHMYADSGGRNVFPLIAAHGALWAAGYFKKGMFGGKLFSLRYFLAPRLRREKLRSLGAFADQFRDINRRVCAESYAIYYYTKYHGGDAFIRSVIGDAFADALCACHADDAFPPAMREDLFRAFFNWEQSNIVGPAVEQAFRQFDWGAIKALARQPRIEFAYFGPHFYMRFDDFTVTAERIVRGLQAYRRAEEVGLDHVEHMLGTYQQFRNANLPLEHKEATTSRGHTTPVKRARPA